MSWSPKIILFWNLAHIDILSTFTKNLIVDILSTVIKYLTIDVICLVFLYQRHLSYFAIALIYKSCWLSLIQSWSFKFLIILLVF